MRFKTIIAFLLAIVAMAGQANTYKTIKSPVAMTCVNVADGELEVREVIMSDTATTVHFTMEYETGHHFRFVKESYLMDEDGNRYPLRSAEGIALDAWVQSPEISFRKGGEMKPMVRKGAIIIDGYSASAAETPVRFVHNHSKTHAKVYGRDNTLGCEQTGNCHEVRLPHSNITMRYPTTVDDTFEKQCRLRNPGYKPDVIIPLDYPKQLTDNIDEWVLWVAKDLKKK